MKSAYELAMERLNKADPQSSKKLTKEQKERIAEIDKIYRAKIAEKEIALEPKIQATRFAGEAETADQLQAELRKETQNLKDQMEREKEKVRNL